VGKFQWFLTTSLTTQIIKTEFLKIKYITANNAWTRQVCDRSYSGHAFGTVCPEMWVPTFRRNMRKQTHETFYVISEEYTTACPSERLVLGYLLVHDISTQTTTKCLLSEGQNNKYFEQGILLSINCKLQRNELRATEGRNCLIGYRINISTLFWISERIGCDIFYGSIKVLNSN